MSKHMPFQQTKNIVHTPGSGRKTNQNPNRTLDPFKKSPIKLTQKQKTKLKSLIK